MRFFLPAILLVLLVGKLDAQKFGYINSALIIQAHPKVATANAELEAFQKSLLDPFTLKAKAFEEKYKMYLEQAAAGTLSKVDAEAKQAELTTEQQALNTEDQQIQFQLLQKKRIITQAYPW